MSGFSTAPPGPDSSGGTGAVFARLFRGERFRFEFGMRRGDARWFRLAAPADPVLAARRHWLTVAAADATIWQPEAAPLLRETLALVGLGAELTEDRVGLVGLAARWEPDFLLLKPDAAGDFRLVGGAVCFPSSWSPAEKLGLTIDEIHAPVPTVNSELGPRIRTFLSRLPPGGVFERENWGLAAMPELNMHPHRGLPRLTADTPLSDVSLRLEEQAFCALPQSGGVLFLIRLTVHPLAALLTDPETRAGFLRQLVTMPDEIASYKGLAAARPNLVRQIGALA
jgi:hypothetical protein